ncbi:hypothetical protein [Paenibacillus sp. NAIST15-1]|uniref:hypothetical protein n=1 Tax=Paenibacillus sp. NAIST15-1 TaxID=1605994 RepID=UPI000869FDAE|nr:hypothetical protein [Paenibacillus sp. NAIST15-1]GAV11411.1 signal transduction histidine kinase regulating citrate/malate metabolism [Paenibacillus sp. NAIST15-1]
MSQSPLYKKMISLTPALNGVIEVASEVKQAREDFNRRYPKVTGHIAEHLDEYIKDEDIRIAKEKFISYMNRLSYDDVVIIDAIMLVGRQEKDPEEYIQAKVETEKEGYEWLEPEEGVFDSPQKKVFDYLKYIKSLNTTKTEIIFSMMEKAPLIDFLQRGMHILDIQDKTRV